MIQIVRRPQIGQRTSSVPQEPEIYSQIFEINTFINVSKMTKVQKSPDLEGQALVHFGYLSETLREFLTKKEVFAAQMRLFFQHGVYRCFFITNSDPILHEGELRGIQ